MLYLQIGSSNYCPYVWWEGVGFVFRPRPGNTKTIKIVNIGAWHIKLELGYTLLSHARTSRVCYTLRIESDLIAFGVIVPRSNLFDTWVTWPKVTLTSPIISYPNFQSTQFFYMNILKPGSSKIILR